MKKVVFSDRDGVINRDSPDYIKNWSEFEFLPGSTTAIRHLTSHGFTTIVITNQSMINRKISSEEDLRHIHAMMRKAVISEGGEIRDIFFCPHAPEEGCDCRKPKPGLIYQAQQAYQIDLKNACMIGDSAKDIECGRNAGCGRVVLVRTGNGITAEKRLVEKNIFPDHIAENFYGAVKWVLRQAQ
ncbi:D-glycero-beta-D-manno-heptose 1,7-bisphosphate 7-phosphatase [Desulfobacterales bacterium HSG2]|nr:D-glycero-beta-D-manno-heptose 1,7-bisphosphate 7-phosphatase [Desulfobacterales bacterium HSG2]